MDYSQIPLRDMQLPETIGWWPLAPGWWVLMLLIVVLIALVGLYIKRKLEHPRRYALAELKEITSRYQSTQDKSVLLSESNSLLKRLAMTLYPREQVAKLSGEDWLKFLAASGAVSYEEIPQAIKTGPYQQDIEFDAQALIVMCNRWLKTVKGDGSL